MEKKQEYVSDSLQVFYKTEIWTENLCSPTATVYDNVCLRAIHYCQNKERPVGRSYTYRFVIFISLNVRKASAYSFTNVSTIPFVVSRLVTVVTPCPANTMSTPLLVKVREYSKNPLLLLIYDVSGSNASFTMLGINKFACTPLKESVSKYLQLLRQEPFAYRLPMHGFHPPLRNAYP